MKKLYSFLALYVMFFSMAQNVTFADPEFKALLVNSTPASQIAQNAAGNWVAIDANGDGEIQLTEAAAIKLLNAPGNGYVTSVAGIKSFVNAEEINVDFLDWIDELDLSNMPNLKILSALDNPFLTTFNISGSTALESVSVSGTDLSAINLSGLPLLQNVAVYNNSTTSVLFTGSNAIKNLNLENNALTSVNLQQFPLLETAELTGNSLTSLNASGRQFLTLLACSFNSLTSLNVQNTPALHVLDASENALTSVNLDTSPALQTLKLNDNLLTSINLTNNTLLTELLLYYNDLTLLDIHANSVLTSVDVTDNNLQTLIIKNGNEDDISYDNNPNLTYICADDAEIPYIVSTNAALGLTNTVVNSYCTFTPGGLYYTVTGNTRFDANSNGCDSSDPAMPLQKFSVTSGTNTANIVGTSSGNYAVHVQSGTHTITPVLENPSYFNVSPASITANFPTQTSPITQNFCLTANGSHNDLEVMIIPMDDAVPGYNARYKVLFKNKGTILQSGTLVFNYNDNVMNFVNSTVVPDSQNTGVLTWNFIDLQPFESDDVLVTFTLNTPTATPALNSGDILNFTAQVTISGTDVTPADNTFALNETVVNSFDPNDKTALQGSSISLAQVGDYVHYLIRFENNGTANAQNIVVKDVIDTAKFDLNSLIVLQGSHSFTTRITSPNTVEFLFENIQLPFNDANNDGFVVFKIKTKTSLVIGDSFSNTANVYFDYNAPITTNTYTTTVQNVFATQESQMATNLVLYPNPVKDMLYFKTAEKITKAEIFDASGRKLGSFSVQNNAVNLSMLKSGMYMIKVFTKNSVTASKLIKQ